MAVVSLVRSLCRTPALHPPAPRCFLGKIRVPKAPLGTGALWVQGPIFSGSPVVERGRQCCGRCLVTPPSWRTGASAPRQGTKDGQKGGQAAHCALITAPLNKGVTSQLQAGAAWGRPGPKMRPGNLVGDGCGGQRAGSCWRRWAGREGLVRGAAGLRTQPHVLQEPSVSASWPRGGVWCLGWSACRARAPGLPGGHWGSPSPRRLRPGSLTWSAVRVRFLPFLF